MAGSNVPRQNFNLFTVSELKSIAKAQGLTGYSRLRRDELLTLLQGLQIVEKTQNTNFEDLPQEIQLEIMSQSQQLLYQSAYLNKRINKLTNPQRVATFCSSSITSTDYLNYFKQYPEEFSFFDLYGPSGSAEYRQISINKLLKDKDNSYLSMGLNIDNKYGDASLRIYLHKHIGDLGFKIHSYEYIGNIRMNCEQSKYIYHTCKKNQTDSQQTIINRYFHQPHFYLSKLTNMTVDLFSQYHILNKNSECQPIAKDTVLKQFNFVMDSYTNDKFFLMCYLLNNLSYNTVSHLKFIKNFKNGKGIIENFNIAKASDIVKNRLLAL